MMKHREPGPHDQPVVSEAQKAEWLAMREMGRLPGLEMGPPSRSKIGRFFDFLERIVGGAQGKPYR